MAGWQLQDEAGKVLIPHIERATGLAERVIGLLGRNTLCDTCGLWIAPCNGIHTWGMRFAIDVVYLNRSGEVLRLFSDVKPNRVCLPVRHTHSVLELPSGTITRLRLCVGATYQLKPTS